MQYREQIEAYLDAHKEEMLADICRLIRINSTKGKQSSIVRLGKDRRKHLQKHLRWQKDTDLQ